MSGSEVEEGVPRLAAGSALAFEISHAGHLSPVLASHRYPHNSQEICVVIAAKHVEAGVLAV